MRLSLCNQRLRGARARKAVASDDVIVYKSVLKLQPVLEALNRCCT
ncbi:MAG: hypothetical protein LLG01_14895 [Planctomycetaceae bacterium]|nr:hypothetical protein [Planctomycetaceae bacterium]